MSGGARPQTAEPLPRPRQGGVGIFPPLYLDIGAGKFLHPPDVDGVDGGDGDAIGGVGGAGVGAGRAGLAWFSMASKLELYASDG